MISIQHACLPSVLAYAAATTLPPSPVESPPRCDSPSTLTNIPDSPKVPLKIPDTPTSVQDQEPEPQTVISTDPVQSKDGSEPTARSDTNPAPEPRNDKLSEQSVVPENVSGNSQTEEACAVTIVQFARQLQLQRHQKVQKQSILHRLEELRISIALSLRLLRTTTTVQKGLVESFNHGDKSGFVSVYNTIHDVRDFCDSASRNNTQGRDDWIGTSVASLKEYPYSFTQRLTPRSRTDLLDILTRLRTDSQFLFQCIGNLTPSQLSALVSPVHSLEISDVAFALPARGKPQPLFSRRTGPHSTAFKEHAFGLERADPLCSLIFNAFSGPLASNSAEDKLRLDVWSSTCAKLVSYGGSGHYAFVGQILSIWASATEWKAKLKFEVYIMDVLQKGAFLLEYSDSRKAGLDGDAFDPLRTEVAENFFRDSVCGLFEVLDDPDAGFPIGALQLGNSILGKLTVPETRKRFLEYLFMQWFFRKFLHNALSFPETHGSLLDFHVTKDARERLLGQISLRAQSQVSRVLRSLPQFSIATPQIRAHVESMLVRLNRPPRPDRNREDSASDSSLPESLLLLSATDIMTMLDVLLPKTAALFNPDPFKHRSSPSSPPVSYFPRNNGTGRQFEPNFFQGRVNTMNSHPSHATTILTTATAFHDSPKSYSVPSSDPTSPVPSPESLVQNAERIRYELLEICESEDRPVMAHVANEDWALISISKDGKELSMGFEDEDEEKQRPHADIHGSISIGGHDRLREAILKLVEELDLLSDAEEYPNLPRPDRAPENEPCGLKRRFMNAMISCQNRSDFVGAHYWWNASRLLRAAQSGKSGQNGEDSVLSPMFLRARHSAEADGAIIKQCTRKFVELRHTMGRLQTLVKSSMAVLTKLRNKLWYMTDVRNSLRYEDARNVALALKSMSAFQPTPSPPTPEPRSKFGARSLGGSFLQKPEVHVMNVMKAPAMHGGPSKLADEQVEITKKWLQRSGIDNFCRGEERIHRFCYEVKTSINKLVGETMLDSPVLWSSELYQKERSMYEASGTRPVPSFSSGASVRPSSITSEDSLYHPSHSLGVRNLDYLLRPPSDVSSLTRKSSLQSLGSERWRSREGNSGDTSSIGDSPGRAPSTITSDSFQPFWSPIQTQAQSTTSVSSFQSRPASMVSSMVSDVLTTKRSDRNSPGKTAFLDELKQGLISLLLSDLGSPVWSCGSETDAWFSDFLNQHQVQHQMEKRERRNKVLAELSRKSSSGSRRNCTSRSGRRRSATLPLSESSEPELTDTPDAEGRTCDGTEFAYEQAFQRLMDKFSRPANPFVKLEALHDLHALVISSLSSNSGADEGFGAPCTGPISSRRVNLERYRRNSVSEGSKLPDVTEDETPTPSSPIPGLHGISPVPSVQPSESQIIRTLRELIQKYQPKTLFRDLQFIASFVPSEVLNRTSAGNAFLQFGLAAFELKDDVCNSMVELADKIVSQELSRRHRRSPIDDFSRENEQGIKDAARMWIITAKEGNPVAQRELAILYLTDPDLLPFVTFPLTMPRDTFKAEMMYRRDRDSKSDPQSMCLALHWMQLSAAGGDELAQNRLREREEFESIA